MTAIAIYILIIIGLNLIPLLGKFRLPKLERVITRISNYSIILYVITLLLLFFSVKFRGTYTNSIIGGTFIVSNLLYFALIKNTQTKIYRVVVMSLIIPISLFIIVFGQPVSQFTINDTHTIEVMKGEFNCGNIIEITEVKFLLFKKKVHYESSLCLRGITKIETLKFDGKCGEFLIYHDGKLDSENPYEYKTQLTNVK